MINQCLEFFFPVNVAYCTKYLCTIQTGYIPLGLIPEYQVILTDARIQAHSIFS